MSSIKDNLDHNLEKYLSKFRANYKYLTGHSEKSPKIAIAVSGGMDSMSLLILAQKWKENYNAKIYAITIDHKLRKESAQESDSVKKYCKVNNIYHETLTWNHNHNIIDIKNYGIENLARIARYDLITDFCNENAIYTLLTAHQLNDEIENIFINFSRGSGISGLSDSRIYYYNNVRIIRPLYNFSKSELEKILKLSSTKWMEDSSNHDIKYSFRNELRPKIKNILDSNFITKELFENRFLQSINNISSSSNIIGTQISEFISEKVTISDKGFSIINTKDINAWPKDIILYALLHILTIISGSTNHPKAHKVIFIIENLYNKESFKLSIHNCTLILNSNQLIIFKELGKNIITPINFVSNIYFDNKFLIQVKSNKKNVKNLTVSYITKEDLTKLKEVINVKSIILNNFFNHKEIIFTIPCIKILENIVAIPHINHYDSWCNLEFNISFKPLYKTKLINFI